MTSKVQSYTMDKDKDKFENVILFPENKIKKKPTPVDPKAQKKMRDYQTAKFVETSTDKLALVMDAIRGLLYRQFGVGHPIHKVIDQSVKLKMNKAGVVTARIEYGNMSDDSTATTKPINKNVSDELNDRNNGMFVFTEDFEFNPFPGEDPSDTDK